MSDLQKANVDLSGLMRVLGEALYSTPQVAIRELVQNAHDSCSRRLLEDPAEFLPQITVAVEPGYLIIRDNGAGLTREEIHAYLATVGAGYTRVLRDQDQSGQNDSHKEKLIGYFGLGFLSAYAISERVEVWTCSYQQPQIAHRFISRNGESYSVNIAEPRHVGSEVRLALRDKFKELCDSGVVNSCVQRYCALLEYPVSMESMPAVNATQPPWRLAGQLSPVRMRALSLDMAKRFERRFEPLAALPINDTLVQGLIWIQDGGSYATSDNRAVSVYVRGMLIGEDERDLLPRWAGFVGAVLESKSLQPTASREKLQKNESYKDTAQVVHRALLSGLNTIAKEDRATWRRILARHNESLLGAALSDPELYKLVANDLTVPTTEGDFTLNALLHRCKGKLYVTQSDQAGMEAMLFRALRMPVVLGTRYAALPFCQRYVRQHTGQVVVLGTQSGDQWLFTPAAITADHEQALRQWFAAPDREVLVRNFVPDNLPFVLVTDREAELKRRLESDEADRRIGQGVLGLARIYTRKIEAVALTRMYINASNPVVIAMLDAKADVRDLVISLLQPLLLVTADSSSQLNAEVLLKQFNDGMLSLLKRI